MGNRAASDPAPCGVILAGGEGRRMGGADKAFVLLSGRPLIRHAIERLAPQVGALAISAHAAGGRDLERLDGLGASVLLDAGPERTGPLAGILAGMIWAGQQGCGHIACVPVDGPFFPLDLVVRLGVGPVPRLATSGGRQHPTFGTWPVHLADPLRAFLASGKVPRVRDFAAQAGAEWVDFADASGFENLNTAEDIAQAEARP